MCGRAGCTGPRGGGGGNTPTGDPDYTLVFYLDYNHYDPDDPYYTYDWYFDTPFTQEQIGLTNPTTAPDPFYGTFKGWSRQALVDEDQYLWDFTKGFSEAETVMELSNSLVYS